MHMQEDQLGLQNSHCFLNLVLTGISINEFLLLKSDGLNSCLFIIIGIWSASIIIAFLNFLFFRNQQTSKFSFIGFLTTHSEWMSCATTMHELAKYAIIQMIIISFPISIINIYLISDTTKDYSKAYYVALVFLNQFFMGVTLLTGIGINQKDKSQTYFCKSIPQICLHFSYWYIIVQSFYYNYIVGVVFLSSNCVFLFLEVLIWRKQIRSEQTPNFIFFMVLRHLFQFNCTVFSTFKKHSRDFYLNNWVELRFAPLQCLNVIVLFIIKMFYFPKIENADIGLYVLLAISSIQIYLTIVNIYYKIHKVNSFTQHSNWNSETLCVSNKALKPLLDNFIYDYHLSIELEWNSFDEKSLYYNQNIQKIKANTNLLSKLIHKGVKISCKNSTIVISDPINNFSFKIIYNQFGYEPPKQIIEFSDKEDEIRNNIKLVNCLNVLISRNIKLTILINKQYAVDIYKMIIDIQMYDNLQYQILEKGAQQPNEVIPTIPAILLLEFVVFQASIKRQMLQALIFKRELSNFLQINPNQVFYDLFDRDEQIIQ